MTVDNIYDRALKGQLYVIAIKNEDDASDEGNYSAEDFCHGEL